MMQPDVRVLQSRQNEYCIRDASNISLVEMQKGLSNIIFRGETYPFASYNVVICSRTFRRVQKEQINEVPFTNPIS